ncbi:MAG: Fe-S cluster assembly ATPase SufC [Candidatus Roizmanbacteria bacterium]|nr:Fe-S cluster assembly ATPase SufC [Candidatus Roizmanbacteria bacterium]
MLSLQNIQVKVGDKEIITDFSYQFEKNKIYAIMGPNGSGKSTLVQSIIGNPLYSLSKKSSIEFNSKKITNLSPDKRAQLGIGITFQTPIALQGISVFQLLRLALKNVDVLKLYEDIEHLAKELKINKELIDRPLNEGASGGERKKLEVLQMAILNPSIIFFDEIDTGVDIDSLKTIFTFLKKYKQDKTFVFITHYSKIFTYLKPDEVLVMKQGKLAATGGKEMIQKIEKKGYEAF